MTLWVCKGCQAKDHEIARLSAQVAHLIGTVSGQSTEALRLARDAAGLTPPPPAGPPPDPLPELVEAFIDSRYDVGTRGWKHAMQAARQFVSEGKAPLQVNELLLRGQPVEY